MRRLLLALAMLVLGTGSVLAAPLPAVAPGPIGAIPGSAAIATPFGLSPTPWPMALSTEAVWASALETFAPIPTPDPTPPPIPTVADAQAWALETLGDQEYQALYLIVWNESRWDPAAVNRRSGACGLGQFCPCSKMSNGLPDWRVQPLAQLRDYVIPYARHKYGSLTAAWAAWLRRGWW